MTTAKATASEKQNTTVNESVTMSGSTSGVENGFLHVVTTVSASVVAFLHSNVLYPGVHAVPPPDVGRDFVAIAEVAGSYSHDLLSSQLARHSVAQSLKHDFLAETFAAADNYIHDLLVFPLGHHNGGRPQRY